MVQSVKRLERSAAIERLEPFERAAVSLAGIARRLRICSRGEIGQYKKGDRRTEGDLCQRRRKHQSKISEPETVAWCLIFYPLSFILYSLSFCPYPFESPFAFILQPLSF